MITLPDWLNILEYALIIQAIVAYIFRQKLYIFSLFFVIQFLFWYLTGVFDWDRVRGLLHHGTQTLAELFCLTSNTIQPHRTMLIVLIHY